MPVSSVTVLRTRPVAVWVDRDRGAWQYAATRVGDAPGQVGCRQLREGPCGCELQGDEHERESSKQAVHKSLLRFTERDYTCPAVINGEIGSAVVTLGLRGKQAKTKEGGTAFRTAFKRRSSYLAAAITGANFWIRFPVSTSPV